jgi:hypothetical protein
MPYLEYDMPKLCEWVFDKSNEIFKLEIIEVIGFLISIASDIEMMINQHRHAVLFLIDSGIIVLKNKDLLK